MTATPVAPIEDNGNRAANNSGHRPLCIEMAAESNSAVAARGMPRLCQRSHEITGYVELYKQRIGGIGGNQIASDMATAEWRYFRTVPRTLLSRFLS
jgi:hypothetical protein